jgi:hypothetical protein
MANEQGESRVSFLVECFRSAHEELITRIRQREEWFKIGLATQIVILAAMSGFEVFGTKTSGTVPPTWLPLISMPISMVFALLYSIEERMVGHLASYLGELPKKEAEVAGSESIIDTFNSSSQLRSSVPGTLNYRCATNILAFIVVPFIVTIWSPPSRSHLERIIWFFDLGLILPILFVIIASWRYRLSIVRHGVSRQ